MEATTSPDWNIVGILGAAREALAAEGATKVALLAVLRDRTDRDEAWRADDGAQDIVTRRTPWGEEGEARTRYTGAAAGALTAAREGARREDAGKFGAERLLRGLLEGDNRAVEMLGACGISPQAVLARLDGATGGQADDLDPLLHPTRDVLLGHSHYRGAPLWMRWLLKLSGVNWAARPAWWARAETYEQARRLGSDKVGTEHVLLAVLATQEVALRYPHLAGEIAPGTGPRYAGGERLARLGVDYAAAHSALTRTPARSSASNSPPTSNCAPGTRRRRSPSTRRPWSGSASSATTTAGSPARTSATTPWSVRWLAPESRAPHEESGRVEAADLEDSLWRADTGLQVSAIAAYFADGLRSGAGNYPRPEGVRPLPDTPSLEEATLRAHELPGDTADRKPVRDLTTAIEKAARLQGR